MAKVNHRFLEMSLYLKNFIETGSSDEWWADYGRVAGLGVVWACQIFVVMYVHATGPPIERQKTQMSPYQSEVSFISIPATDLTTV